MRLIDFKIYSPSFGRASLACTHKQFPRDMFYYCVREDQANDYLEKTGAQVLSIPKSEDGSIAKARNWILRNKISRYIVMADDDIFDFRWILRRKFKVLDQSEIVSQINNGFVMAEDANAGLWGVNCQYDPKFYRVNMPFSFQRIVLGTFSCILDTTLRYDESLPLKEDYDFFLQNIKKSGRVLRMNFLSYYCDHQKMAGGCQSYRTQSAESDNFDRLQKKWGQSVVQKNNKHKGSINPIIRI